MVQINVTLSLNEETYKQYQKFCEENTIALSKSVEKFMSDKINGNKK
jgi:hypothetical protein